MFHVERSKGFSKTSFMFSEYALQIALLEMADVTQTFRDQFAGVQLVASSSRQGSKFAQIVWKVLARTQSK